jgi:hypothetical protein
MLSWGVSVRENMAWTSAPYAHVYKRRERSIALKGGPENMAGAPRLTISDGSGRDVAIGISRLKTFGDYR